jgi:uncharacterized delta-60 repeat protein
VLLAALVAGLWAPGAVMAAVSGAALDGSFGDGGIASLPVNAPAGALAVQRNGEILVGSSGELMRLLADGRPDTQFGSDGLAPVPGVGAIRRILVVGPTRIIVLGSAVVALDGRGRVDTAFGHQGYAVLPASLTLNDMALAPDGSIVLVGALPGTGGIVVRLGSDGQLSGSTVLPAQAQVVGHPLTSLSFGKLAVAPAGDVLLTGAGTYWPQGTYLQLPVTAVARLTPSLNLDPSFGSDGMQADGSFAVNPAQVQSAPDGTVTLGGLLCGGGVARGACSGYVERVGADAQPPHFANLGCQPCGQIGTFAALPDGGWLLTLEGTPQDEFQHTTSQSVVFERFSAGAPTAAGFAASGFGLAESSGTPLGDGLSARLPDGTHTGGLSALQPTGRIVIAGERDGRVLVARLLGLRSSIRIPPQRLRLSPSGTMPLRVSCSSSFTCSGSVAIVEARSHRRLARAPLTVSVGKSTVVRVALTNAVRRRLRRQHEREVIVRVELDNGPAAQQRVLIHAR